MKNLILIYFILCNCHIVLSNSYVESDNPQEYSSREFDAYSEGTENVNKPKSNGIQFHNCWMTLNTSALFKVMDDIDERYESIRQKIQQSVVAKDFDGKMMSKFIGSGGAALRELYKYRYQGWMIPSGINLGGFCLVRLSESILFFHRMKLRNNTYFRVNYLQNDLANMLLNMHLSLNDLHLKGAYERSLTDRDPSVLIYAPTFGEVDFLLKNVRYRMEGRYRLIKNRLLIELISSEIKVDDILMSYVNQSLDSSVVRIQKENIGSFLVRLKTDLDKWLKDYFNDFMIYADMEKLDNIDKLEKYDKEKETALEEWTDNAIDIIRNKIKDLNANSIRVPMFTFKTINGLVIKMYDGFLLGLGSMYRRSVATGVKQRDVYKLDTIVGFSNLKVVYKYEAMIPTGVPPLTGVFTLSANEAMAHLALAMVNEPEAIDLDIEFMGVVKPESLTVEGAANVLISNFKHLLENQITATMSSTLIHGIRMLRSLPRCEPFVPGQLPTEKKKMKQLNNNNGQREYDYVEDVNQELTELEDSEENSNSPEYKIALRSTQKPKTQKKELNKTAVARKIRKINIIKLKNKQ